MTVPSHQIAKAVESRARSRCEYCRMHQSLQGATFHVEHIFPRAKGGSSAPQNLAWCCPSCNLHKSDRVDAMDPESSEVVPLFNPRQSAWSVHFKWGGYQLLGQTSIGRATIIALNLNSSRRQLIRRAEERFSLFPPDTEFTL